MKVNAIYFKDKKCWHIKFSELDCYYKDKLFRINGQNVELKPKVIPSEGYYAEYDIMTDTKGPIKVEIGTLTDYISHYMNRENQETMSVFAYEEALRGFKDINGEYKDLDNEYLYRKMKATYIPVRNSHYTYREVSITMEVAEYKVDEYTVCAGMLNKQGNFFLYEFNLRQFAEDTVRKIAKELDIKEVASDQRTCQTKDQFKIYPRTESYKFLEMFGLEYFLKLEDLFFYDRNRFLGYVYGTLDEVRNTKKIIEDKIRTKIEYEVDSRRTVKVKRSQIEAIKDGLNILLTKSLTKVEMQDKIKEINDDVQKLTKYGR